MKTFPFFDVDGDNAQVGERIGSLLGERVQSTYAFYEGLFCELSKIDPGSSLERARIVGRVHDYADQLALTIQRHFPLYGLEIEALAAAANVPAWQVYALNGRTEIYRLLMEAPKPVDPGECTALYFPESRLLGQNWDWHPHLEDLTIIVRFRRPDGHTVLMLTEPGIIGKIGLNSAGLGVCLNILFGTSSTRGVPIHILLRAVLDSPSIEAAHRAVQGVPLGTSSNMLIADRAGQALDLEIRGAELTAYPLEGPGLIHTNHYLADESTATTAIPGSVKRLARARELFPVHSGGGLAGMKAILADRENGEFPICRGYSKGIDFLVGTVASVIQDLAHGKLLVSRGQAASHDEWAAYSLV